MGIPYRFDPLGTLGATRSVSIGPFAADEVVILDPIGNFLRCKTLTGDVLIEAVSDRVSSLISPVIRTPKELLYKNIDYAPLYDETYLGNGGVYKLIFSRPCKPVSISFSVIDLQSDRSLVINTPDGQELARINGGRVQRNITLPLMSTGKITEIDILAAKNIWFNGISLHVEI